MDFNSIQIEDIGKTLNYAKSKDKNDTEDIIYDFIYTELLKIDSKIVKKDTQNYVTDKAYYCIRTNYLKGLAFGGISKNILGDISKPLFLVLLTNKNVKEIKLDTYNNGNRPKNGSISYTEDNWEKLNVCTTDAIAEKIIELLKGNSQNNGK